MKNNKGFTLSEVLVTIALISIILLIVVPSIMLITRRINKRIFEGKKEVILAAAELYGKDNSSSFDHNSELQITVAMLLETGYIEPDEKSGSSKCNEIDIDTKGCMINPVDKSNINEIPIRIIKKNDTYNALWDESLAGQEVNELMKLICDKLEKNKSKNLTTNENGESCGCTYEIDETTQKWNPDTIELSPNTSSFCYFKEEDPKNWLYYSGIDFRVIGIEKEENNYFVKLITDDNI